MLQTNDEQAIEFMKTLRGQFLISKALYLAIQNLEAKEEISKDITDMRYLQDHLFPYYKNFIEKNSCEA